MEELSRDPQIIRNRLKIRAAVNNARIFLEISREYGEFFRVPLALDKGRGGL